MTPFPDYLGNSFGWVLEFVDFIPLPDPGADLEANLIAFFGVWDNLSVNLHWGNGLGQIRSVPFYFYGLPYWQRPFKLDYCSLDMREIMRDWADEFAFYFNWFFNWGFLF